MDTDKNRFDGITEQVIAAAYRVHNILGCGFLEKVYENAMVIELRKRGLRVRQQAGISVLYEGTIVGEYIADLLVEETVVIELKAIKSLDPVHSAQCINYLVATRFPICLLINFATKVEVKRLAGPTL